MSLSLCLCLSLSLCSLISKPHAKENYDSYSSGSDEDPDMERGDSKVGPGCTAAPGAGAPDRLVNPV